MSDTLWTEVTKQSILDEFYETLKRDPTATEKEVAMRLARFTEAQIYGAANRRIIVLETTLKEMKRTLELVANARHPNT